MWLCGGQCARREDNEIRHDNEISPISVLSVGQP